MCVCVCHMMSSEILMLTLLWVSQHLWHWTKIPLRFGTVIFSISHILFSATLAVWNLLEMYCLPRLTSADFIARDSWKPCEQQAFSVLQLCDLKCLQTGVADCASVHWNSWGWSSVLTGDDITWQVFIWLISHSLAPSQAPDTCFTSRRSYRKAGLGRTRAGPLATSFKFSHASILCQDQVRRRWGKRTEAGYAVLLTYIATLWQVRCFASMHQ